MLASHLKFLDELRQSDQVAIDSSDAAQLGEWLQAPTHRDLDLTHAAVVRLCELVGLQADCIKGLEKECKFLQRQISHPGEFAEGFR